MVSVATPSLRRGGKNDHLGVNPFPIVKALSWSLRCRTLGADPKTSTPRGWAGDSPPGLFQRPGRPELDVRASGFEGSQYTVRPHVPERLFFGYEGV
jgi:hypothetical protein